MWNNYSQYGWRADEQRRKDIPVIIEHLGIALAEIENAGLMPAFLKKNPKFKAVWNQCKLNKVATEQKRLADIEERKRLRDEAKARTAAKLRATSALSEEELCALGLKAKKGKFYE